jgi:hypothetical protein
MELIEVRDLLRHSTISMTERYAKLVDGDLGAAMASQTGPLGFRDQLRLAQ